MITYLKSLFKEARTKVTTYLALGAAGLSQLADHAQAVHDDFPQLKAYLPQGPMIEHISHTVLTVLGFLIVWSRVRQLIDPPKPQ